MRLEADNIAALRTLHLWARFQAGRLQARARAERKRSVSSEKVLNVSGIKPKSQLNIGPPGR